MCLVSNPIINLFLSFSVCSTTLWVGHLSKLVADEDLSDLFGEYGMVESINLIPPRGCAFVHMNRRMDAYKALKELHKHKLHGKPITVSPEKFRIPHCFTVYRLDSNY